MTFNTLREIMEWSHHEKTKYFNSNIKVGAPNNEQCYLKFERSHFLKHPHIQECANVYKKLKFLSFLS